MIAIIEYELNGVKKTEKYDFHDLVFKPDAAGIEYRFHQRMQLKKQYKCFDNELTEVCYARRYEPEDYRLLKITLIGNDSGRMVYDHFGDFETPIVTRRQRNPAPEQTELDV